MFPRGCPGQFDVLPQCLYPHPSRRSKQRTLPSHTAEPGRKQSSNLTCKHDLSVPRTLNKFPCRAASFNYNNTTAYPDSCHIVNRACIPSRKVRERQTQVPGISPPHTCHHPLQAIFPRITRPPSSASDSTLPLDTPPQPPKRLSPRNVQPTHVAAIGRSTHPIGRNTLIRYRLPPINSRPQMACLPACLNRATEPASNGAERGGARRHGTDGDIQRYGMAGFNESERDLG